jgi:predicted TIM-barrel fold metal-dependent hydrolase
VIKFVKHHAARGSKIILHTCRENNPTRPLLDEAVKFCEAHGIPLYAVNENPGNPYPERYGTSPGRKVYADLYIDDKAVNPAEIERAAAEWKTIPARIAGLEKRLKAL